MDSAIRSLRERAGLSQTDFARELNIGVARLWNYESGYRPLPVDVARKMQPILSERGIQTTLDDFYPRNGSCSSPAQSSGLSAARRRQATQKRERNARRSAR